LKHSYLKPPLSYEEQTQLLKSRNLTISNEEFCTRKLQHINYYRLSAYFYPFYDEKNSFKNDAKFEDVLKLYYFDKEFKNLLFYSIEKVEVYMRTQLAYILSQEKGAFAYVDVSLFHDAQKHQDIMNIIKSETGRSKEVFVKEFFTKYDEKYLPVWAMVEIVSFNTLSKIFANLKEKYRKDVLRDIDIKPLVFESWLHTITYVRNICAHHSRLWNKMLAIEPMKPKNHLVFKSLNSKKVFYVICMIMFILQKIDDEEFDFQIEIQKLTLKYPNVDLVAMGFVDEWMDLQLCR